MKNNTQLEELINKINELYITERKKYLILNKEGTYTTFTKGKNSPMSLNDKLVEKHLKGEHTVGVFSGGIYSKFICFDLDMVDTTKLKWITQLTLQSLYDLGISEEYVHVASSGNKGNHVLVYFNTPTLVSSIKVIFIKTMNVLASYLSLQTRLHTNGELFMSIGDICNIEFRPTPSQGVKLELGLNFRNTKTDNRCLFLNKDTFEQIVDDEYFLSIQPINVEEIEHLFEKDEDLLVEQSKELIITNIKESHAHKVNRDETETIAYMKDLLMNGMNTYGSRNNSVFKLARYFSYTGLDLSETIVELKEWMLKQDRKYYSSSLEYALSECERIATMVYEKGYNLVGEIDNLKIYKNEVLEVMQIKEKNAKTLLFTMLLHSKRFANADGTFYMTYSQIESMCGLGKVAIQNNISTLEQVGLLEVIERNRVQKGTHIKKPNRYKVLIEAMEESGLVLEVDNSNGKLDYTDAYMKSVVTSFTDKELRKLGLHHKQVKEFKEYRKLLA